MEKEPIYVDISHIINWSGVLTGIERVEFHIITHHLNTENAFFIYWSKKNKNFVKATNDFVIKNIINKADGSTQSYNKKPILSKISKIIQNTQHQPIDIKEAKILILAGLWDDDQYIEGLQKLAVKNKLIHVIYDMIPIIMPNFVVDYLPKIFSNYMLKILPVCYSLACISKATARDTEKILKENDKLLPKIFTFRLGDELIDAEKKSKPLIVKNKVPFILSVGTIESRKNHWLIYYAYKKLYVSGHSLPDVYIVGKRGWLTGDFQYILENDIDLKNKIHIADKVNDKELTWLYKNCLYTIFPSFYEGWGLPVAESLAYGKVTLASSTGSIPEVGEACVDYFSPYSSDELAGLIVKYSDIDLISRKSKKIKSNYQTMSWKIATNILYKKINSI